MDRTGAPGFPGAIAVVGERMRLMGGETDPAIEIASVVVFDPTTGTTSTIGEQTGALPGHALRHGRGGAE